MQITPKILEIISEILSKENDVLIKFRKNKNEIEVFEQKNSVKEKIKINK